MDNSIAKLLDRAKLLAERGQIRMAAMAMDEIDKRLETTSLDAELEEQYNSLCELVPLTEDLQSETTADSKCHKCNGTGKHRNGGRCYACLGKGTQSTRDIVREKNYWARRQASAAKARDRAATIPF